MTSPRYSHPLEAVHAARDAIEAAASQQAHIADPSVEELSAYGSALASLMRDLSNFAEVLTHQAATYDVDQLDAQKYRNEPVGKYSHAVRNLVVLCEVLREGAKGAARYWIAVEQTHDDLKPPPETNGV